MGYIKDVEHELRMRLDRGDLEGAVAYAKEKTRESYRNGIKVGAEAKDSRREVAPAEETQNAGT